MWRQYCNATIKYVSGPKLKAHARIPLCGLIRNNKKNTSCRLLGHRGRKTRAHAEKTKLIICCVLFPYGAYKKPGECRTYEK